MIYISQAYFLLYSLATYHADARRLRAARYRKFKRLYCRARSYHAAKMLASRRPVAIIDIFASIRHALMRDEADFRRHAAPAIISPQCPIFTQRQPDYGTF